MNTRKKLDAAWDVFREGLPPLIRNDLDQLRAAEDALEADRCRSCRCVVSDPDDRPFATPCNRCRKTDRFGDPLREQYGEREIPPSEDGC